MAQLTPAAGPRCRFCRSRLQNVVVDLGMSPLCESYLSQEQLGQMEPFYPLRVYVCGECLLVQLEAFVSAEDIFSEYAYFSSYSDSWVEHARAFAEEAITRLQLDTRSQVIELASNDGYLLQHFMSRGIPVLGIEPAANVAKVAQAKGIPTLVQFFGEKLATELAATGPKADLIVANNVLAQVPDLNDFVKGMKLLLKPAGVISVEFPHVVKTIMGNQFDQIYHEHFSYFSLTTVQRVFADHGLTTFDVRELPTHGGSLRVFARHDENSAKRIEPDVRAVLQQEAEAGFNRLDGYAGFAERVKETKCKLLSFLISAKRAGKTIVGYGAPGKGNTLLNYCGIRTDFLDFTVDRSPHKQGKYLPGTHIPILHPDKIKDARPDYVLILPWNLKNEIMAQLAYIRQWGGQFVVPIPQVNVVS
jgi:SAM-dependent methyltransferase